MTYTVYFHISDIGVCLFISIGLYYILFIGDYNKFRTR